MVTTWTIGAVGTRAGAPRGISAAVLFTILFHIALGWYVISRFMFVPALDVPDEPLVIQVEPYVKPAPPPPPAAPLVIPDQPTKPPFPIRSPVRFPVPTDVSTLPLAPTPPAPGTSVPAVSAPVASPPAAPSPTYKIDPVFPIGAIDDGISGKVTVQLAIGPGGEVTDARIMEETPPNHGFGKSAVAAVRQWKFATAAPGTYRVTVKFALGD